MKHRLLRIIPLLLLGGVLGLAAAPAAFDSVETKAETTFPINNNQEFAGSAVSGWEISPQSNYCSLYYSGGKVGASTITNKNIADFSVFASGTYSLKVYVSGICNGGDPNNTLAVTMINSSGVTVGETISKTKQLGGGDAASKAKESSVYTFTPSTSVSGLKIEIGLKCALTKVRWNITKVSDDDPEPIKPTTYYTKVTDAASLQVGQTIVLGCKDKNAVAGVFSTNILTSKTAVFEDDKVYSNDAEEITLGGVAGNWKLLVSAGQIGTSEIGKFNLTSDTEWSISITGGVATIETANYGSIQYNVSNPRFVNYTSSQTPIEIYKKDGAIETYTVTYNANSGGTGSVIDSNSPYNKASSVIVLENAFTPITGKTFVEWNTSADGTGISYDAGDVFTIMGDTTLYAIWEDEYIPIGDTYAKATDTSVLKDGTQFLFVYTSGSVVKANGSLEGGDHFKAYDAKIVDDELSYNNEKVQPLTLEKTDSQWYIKLGSNYLTLTANSSNKLAWKTKDKANKWSISFKSGNAYAKSSVEGVEHCIYYNASGPRFANYSSTTMSPIELWVKSGHAKEVHLDVDVLELNKGDTGTVKVSECLGFDPSSYSWEITSGSEYASIVGGQGTDEVEISALAEGEAELYVTVDGIKAKADIIVHDYKYNILDKENYFITANGVMLGGDLSYITDVDFTDSSNMWHFEKAYDGDNSYYLTANSKYLSFSEDVYPDGKNISQIELTDIPYNVWTVSYNESSGYKVSTETKSQGTRSLAHNEEKWYAYPGNNYVDLMEGGTYDHYAVEALPTTKQYFVGDALKPHNSHVYAYYTNGYKSEITNKITWDTLTAGSKAYGKCTILGEEVDIEMDGLQIYKGDASTFLVNGLSDTFYAGERINKDNLTVSITYKFPGAEDIVKDKLLKDDYVIEPEKIQETTTSVKISLAKDPTVYVGKNISVVQNSYVAAAHVHEGDKIVIGTLGYDPYEIKGGYELTYDDKFGYSTFDYMPHGELPLEVGKKDGYYTLKDPGTGYFLKGDNSAFGFYEPDWKSSYPKGDGHYEITLNVNIAGGTKTITMKTGLNPDFSYGNEFSSMDYVGGYDDYIVGISDLYNYKLNFKFYSHLNGYDGPYEEVDVALADWDFDNNVFRYALQTSEVLPDECLFTLNYDEDYEEWVISSKPHQDKQLYYNKDGKFGFYAKGSSYTPVMVFRDNNLPLESDPTSVSVSFRTYETEEGPVPMNTVSVGEQFPWTSALIVKANYGGGASKVLPVGGYTIKQMPDTSKIGPSKGIISYGQIGHEKEVEFTIYVTGHTQAFEIKGDRDPILVGEECQLRVEPAAPEGEPIKWSVDHPEFASISETGLLKGIAPGYINVTATSFDGTYSDTVKIQIYQQVESVTLDKHEVELNAGETSQLTATVKPDNASNKNVTYSSSDTSVAFVDAKTGLITAVSEGTATITCEAQNHPERNFDTCEVTVKPAPIVHVTGITLDCNYKELEKGSSFNLIATITPENATVKNVTWSSNHENIAKVDQNGKVIAKDKGECEITVTTADGGFTAKCTIKVKASVEPVPVTGISLNVTSKKLAINESFDLIATIEPGNADTKQVSFTSSNDSVASVEQHKASEATITGLKDGVATITARCGGKEATCTVTVGNGTISVTSVSLSETSVELFTNETKTLTATVNPNNATNKNVTWSSSDTNIVTVDSNGKITAVKEGSAVITVTTVDGGKTATCNVTVKKGNTPTPDGGDDNTVAIIIGSASGIVAVGTGCGVGIPLGIRAHKKRRLGK